MRVGSLDVDLMTPVSLAERYEVLGAEGQGVAPTRIFALALALCWPRLRRELQREGHRYDGRPADFGGRVLDHLLGNGVPFAEIVTAGRQALELCARDLPGLEVPKDPGNSEGAAAESTGT